MSKRKNSSYWVIQRTWRPSKKSSPRTPPTSLTSSESTHQSRSQSTDSSKLFHKWSTDCTQSPHHQNWLELNALNWSLPMLNGQPSIQRLVAPRSKEVCALDSCMDFQNLLVHTKLPISIEWVCLPLKSTSLHLSHLLIRCCHSSQLLWAQVMLHSDQYCKRDWLSTTRAWSLVRCACSWVSEEEQITVLC